MAELFHQMPTALELAALIRSRQVSPVEALTYTAERIRAVNPQVNAIVWSDDAEAKQRAKAMEHQLAHRRDAEFPPFFGVPIPIKDLTEMEGWPATYGSLAVSDDPKLESELVVRAFERAGFVLFGRTNAPEFGPIPVTENLRYGVTRNPWNLDLTPGGSSGGAAAAVASGMFAIAHGNDGGGSIRIPASCCGLVGLKVARGRVPSRNFSWEGGSVEGVLSRDVADAAAVLDEISGPDPLQWYNAPTPEFSFTSALGKEPARLRVGMVTTAPFGLPVDDECLRAVEATAQALDSLGHVVEAFELPNIDDFLGPFLNVVNTGLAGYRDVNWAKADLHIQRNRETALAVSSLDYVQSVADLQRWTRGFLSRWGTDFDVLLSPTMAILPPRAGAVLEELHASGETSSSSLTVLQMAVFTSAFNMTGQPAISLPVHVTQTGVPVGVQLVAGPWDEYTLIGLAAQLERALGWRARRLPSF
ncbi:amidase [Ferrimicrobium sp.]|uniref:amidase n=1 Tax=Ferrimicrobium sp. TaxID=2926050 RepID=UPI0026365EF7|nr:amidase [Ferrimicrobium sp.]